MNTRGMDIAVFDLDGTITRHDTLVHFLAGFAARRPVRALGLWRSPVALGRYLAGGGDRGELKASLIRYLLGGLETTAVALGFHGRRLAERLVRERLGWRHGTLYNGIQALSRQGL
ncbi:MAG: hypothetical protein ACO3C6_10310, partial [Steroidobacteraceae bacterium]